MVFLSWSSWWSQFTFFSFFPFLLLPTSWFPITPIDRSFPSRLSDVLPGSFWTGHPGRSHLSSYWWALCTKKQPSVAALSRMVLPRRQTLDIELKNFLNFYSISLYLFYCKRNSHFWRKVLKYANLRKETKVIIYHLPIRHINFVGHFQVFSLCVITYSVDKNNECVILYLCHLTLTPSFLCIYKYSSNSDCN